MCFVGNLDQITDVTPSHTGEVITEEANTDKYITEKYKLESLFTDKIPPHFRHDISSVILCILVV
ncbi:hypothetical protein SLEP1_g53825 [Rubroshorea leprosula]|uniref:Uncharacterized protein n=1 Tax=Rubroshorea leprosula TaxID=152421 RepID=A0AAV5MDD0_9ROSI|nr:hypothetical protein SLEP1_g53825 [Rubroshorea leprosula]